MTANGKDNVVACRREGRDAVTKAIQNVLKENKKVAIWWRLGNEKKSQKGVNICIVAGCSSDKKAVSLVERILYRA